MKSNWKIFTPPALVLAMMGEKILQVGEEKYIVYLLDRD